MAEPIQRIRASLERIYGEKKGAAAFEKILRLIREAGASAPPHEMPLSEKDVVLICYGDSLHRAQEKPLKTLQTFAETHLADVFSTLHILPFFPYSSDDGFSITDYAAVRPDLGTWQDIQSIAASFKIMMDLVLNHVSAESDWFRRYLRGEKRFEHLALEADPSNDLSRVVRPRAWPLLTEFRKDSGKTVHLWTTFSADQIDLNFQDLNVLALMVEILLLYVEKGAAIIRLDAIAYLWKEVGTSCIHLPQTHEMVKLFRAILDAVSPGTLIITETNVPHAENISYFGTDFDEAQLVYNFTLPPLLLHAFVAEDASYLTQWAQEISRFPYAHAFFNFSASHDGIGVRPLEGILPLSAVELLAAQVRRCGGKVSYKKNSDGSESPYELNITYVDALAAKGFSGDATHAGRFLASQSIPLVFPGIPAAYIHSLLGSRNWVEGVKKTGRARSINRESLDADAVLRQLKEPGSFRAQIFNATLDMIQKRRRQRAFHPKAAFEVMELGAKIFAVVRSRDDQRIYAITNVSSQPVSVDVRGWDLPQKLPDLISGSFYETRPLRLAPYQYVWLCRKAAV